MCTHLPRRQNTKRCSLAFGCLGRSGTRFYHPLGESSFPTDTRLHNPHVAETPEFESEPTDHYPKAKSFLAFRQRTKPHREHEVSRETLIKPGCSTIVSETCAMKNTTKRAAHGYRGGFRQHGRPCYRLQRRTRPCLLPAAIRVAIPNSLCSARCRPSSRSRTTGL